MDYTLKKQIDDDIKLIQEQYGYIGSGLSKNEYAFNICEEHCEKNFTFIIKNIKTGI